jgi:hypothetical protein
MIPCVIGATGTISRSFQKYLSYKPGEHQLEEVQNILGILDITHTYRTFSNLIRT